MQIKTFLANMISVSTGILQTLTLIPFNSEMTAIKKRLWTESFTHAGKLTSASVSQVFYQ